jgi:hypothetical protein
VELFPNPKLPEYKALLERLKKLRSKERKKK